MKKHIGNTDNAFWGDAYTALAVKFKDGRSCFVRWDGMIFPAGETDWDGFWDNAVCIWAYGKIEAGMEFRFKRERFGKTCTYIEVPADWILGGLVNEVVLIASVSEFAISGEMLTDPHPWP